jgi:hypothetical protein
MTDERDGEEEMRHAPLDDDTTDRLLAGAVAPDDAPPGFARVAALIQASRAAADPSELGAGEAIGVVAAAVRGVSEPHPVAPQRKSMLAKLLTVKVAAIGGVALFGATAAAASTGTLPTPAQTAVSGALDKVGVSVPTAHGADKGAKKGVGNPKAEYGHCTAFLNGPGDDEDDTATSTTSTTGAGTTTTGASGKYSAPPFAALIAAHGGTVESTTAYCEGVVAAKHATTTTTPGATTTSTTKDTGRPASPGKSGDAPKPSEPGTPSDPGKPASPGKSGEHVTTTTTSTDPTTTTSTGDEPGRSGGGASNGKGHGSGKP